jgi:hypothetical protein
MAMRAIPILTKRSSVIKSLATAVSLAAVLGCGHYLIPGPFQPAETTRQVVIGEGNKMEVFDDGSVTFIQNRLEVSVRAMLDDELNRQFASLSDDSESPADEIPTNAFTFGDWIDPKTGKSPSRFSIFKVSVKNYEYPKVRFDPLKVVITSDNGRDYYAWGTYDVEEYFRRFVPAFNGIGYRRYSERRDMIERSRYPDSEFVFSGQETEGYILFPVIHSDVAEINFRIPVMGIRFNFRDEPTETLDLTFRFDRELLKVKTYEEVASQP